MGAFCYAITMKQIIVIHGGTTFKDYDEYLKSLSTKEISIERLEYKHKWKERLAHDLGEEYQVLLPSMPNATNARYDEWKTWFEHISQVIEDDCVLIGHSLGAVFLAKILSEESMPFRIKATVLIAAPYDDESRDDLAGFRITNLTDRLIRQAGRLVFFNGLDDPVISTEDLHKYQTAIPTAEFNIMSAPDHFVREEFPELVTLLKDM